MSLHLGSIAPDFEQNSTVGLIRFHHFLGQGWGVLFSHPHDFTPVCTTELGRASSIRNEFDKRNVKLLALSVDDVESHLDWAIDIAVTQGIPLNFPIVADTDRRVAKLYDMIHPEADDTATVRSVFIVDPAKKIRAIITYPASTGRNFAELLRAIDSLKLTDHYKVATPADWQNGDDVVIVPALRDPAEINRRFPRGYTELRPYLRLTPQPPGSGLNTNL